ncbi:alpha/beta hydrolase fold-domain-containing protein, partial [Mycena rosella]
SPVYDSSPSLRLAPEHPFPTGLNDCYAALKWTAANAAELSGAPAKGFLIGGASAGAHYAAILGQRPRDDLFFTSTELTGQILQIPAVVHTAAYPERFKADLLSMEQSKDAPILNKADGEFFWSESAPSDPEASPLILLHEGLSPAYIQVAGFDPLRNEGLLYERLLRESGVKTKLDVYPGVPHGFHGLPLAASKKWEADFRAGLGWLLSDRSADGVWIQTSDRCWAVRGQYLYSSIHACIDNAPTNLMKCNGLPGTQEPS